MASAATPKPSRLISGDAVPSFIYGTAWKKERTRELVVQALGAGFRAVDTAAQPRHYQENLVGDALREAYREGIAKREDLYVQTKYTTPAGQDLNNMPYHPLDPLATQIHTSVASSLRYLRSKEETEENSYLDCLLLHSPLPTVEQTLEAWKLLETYVPHKIRALGISNVKLQILEAIHQESSVKPSVVQNRFYPQTRYDVPLRQFCRENNITYQSFWTLTGNPTLLKSKAVTALSGAAAVSKSVALYALVMDLDITVLNGTTTSQHMDDDLAGFSKVREWALTNAEDWEQIRISFQRIVEP